MDFFVIPREIWEINKWGGGGGVCKNHEKNKRLLPVYFEPENINNLTLTPGLEGEGRLVPYNTCNL